MKERPIIFSGEMVRAILDGRKTQTRRVIKGGFPNAGAFGGLPPYRPGETSIFGDEIWQGPICPYGAVGDRLWVKETWGESKIRDREIADRIRLIHHAWRYRADAEVEQVQVFGRHDLKTKAELYKWRPSIFMPRRASRITLEITEIRVQRLHDISEEDAKAEGVTPEGMPDVFTPYRVQLKKRWNAINGNKHPWESNPWVWAISFKRIENDEQ